MDRRPLRTWQLWNEPNLRAYWHGPWAKPYAQLLKAGRSALRSVDPGAKVVLGGLIGYSWTSLDALYRAGGTGQFDAVAIHPYTADPVNVLKIVGKVRAVMARHGDAKKSLQLTELGWPASKGKVPTSTTFRIGTTSQGQEDRLRAAYPLLAAARRANRITGVYWFQWVSDYRSRRELWDYAGLRKIAQNGKIVSQPVLSVFKRTVAGL